MASEQQWSLLQFLQSEMDKSTSFSAQQVTSNDSSAFSGHFDAPRRCGDWQQHEFVAPLEDRTTQQTQSRMALLSHEMQSESRQKVTKSIGLSGHHKSKATANQQQEDDVAEPVRAALVANCASYASALGLSPLQLASQIVQNAQQSSEEQLQSELFGLVGVDGFELIAFVVQNRMQIATIRAKSLQEPTISSPLTGTTTVGGFQAQVPVYGSAFSIQMQSQQQSQKQHRKLTKRNKHNQQQTSSPMTNWLEASGYDPEVLRLQKEFAEEEMRQTPTSLLQEQFGMLDGGYDTSSPAGLLNSAGRFTLPDRAKRTQHNGYEKVYIPASSAPKLHSNNAKLIPIQQLEMFARSAFKGITHLNRLQSELFHAAYHSNQNLLVCAPTGAGKTNVAMLTVVQEIKSQLVRKAPQLLHAPQGLSIGEKLREVKIIYVAPMKALAQEVVTRFSKRLRDLGLEVAECTGDMQLSRKEIEATHVIVTTPEKWDVITRKSGAQQSLINQVRLLILDEVHLLADERGPVIETIVARTLRRVESSQSMIRIVGLSATLPNYQDVAKFLRVGNSPATGLFHFDASYRPVPLDQTFIGVSTQKLKEDPEQLQEEQQPGKTPTTGEQDNKRNATVKRALTGRQLVQYRMNKLTYDHCVKQLRQGQQVMVFVHSRKETAATIRSIVEFSREADAKTDGSAGTSFGDASPEKPISKNKDKRKNKKSKDQGDNDDENSNVFKESDFAKSLPIELSQRVAKSRNRELKEFLAYGMGIHHAGMLRYDRNLTEELFEKGYVRVLCCTATLAWGVNLPAHSVLIKGTEVYNADKGGISQLSMLDVMQIFGRAGRPQYDTFGEATLLTTQDQLSHFMRLLCNGIPIESSLIKFLPDHLNAEIVSGSVCNMQEACEWLSYTYLFVRMQRNPLAYGVSLEEKQSDPQLVNRRQQLIAQAVDKLVSCRMIKYFQQGSAMDANSNGLFAVTSLGRVASHFYICHQSVETFNELLVPRIRSVASTDQAQSGVQVQAQDQEDQQESFSMERVLLVICSSTEFEQLKSREEEMNELDKLRKNFCRFDVLGGGVESYAGKTNVLLQSFISKARVSSFTLISDTNYVAQNASRVCRALFEICLKKNNSDQAEKFLWVAKAIDQRLWWDQSPMFQVPLCPMEAIATLETKRLDPYEVLADDLFVNGMKERKKVKQKQDMKKQDEENSRLPSKFKRFVMQLPYLDLLRAKMQPIGTGNVLKVGLELVPLFDWHDRMHGGTESWWIWMEDAISGHIYHSEHFFLHSGRFYQWKDHVKRLQTHMASAEPNTQEEFIASDGLKGMEMEFYVPIFLSDQQDEAYYTLRILSDKWVGIESFYELTYKPAVVSTAGKSPSASSKPGVVVYTKQLNLHPVALQVVASAMEDSALFELFARKWLSNSSRMLLNQLQSQVVHDVVHKRNNLLLAMPSASGKTFLAESAMLSLWGKRPTSASGPGLVLYVTPFEELARQMAREWRWKFGAGTGGGINKKKANCELPLVELMDDSIVQDSSRLKALVEKLCQSSCHRGLLVASASQWELVTRQMSETFVKKIGLVVVDELQFVGNEVATACDDSCVDGPVGILMETVVTRLRRISCQQTNDSIRFLGLSCPLANAKSVGNWLGCRAANEVHNFQASTRPTPLHIHIQGFPEPHYVSRMTAMNKPTFAAIEEYSGGRSALIFVSSRAQTRLTAIDLISSCASSQDSSIAGGKRFLKIDEESLEFLCGQRVQDDTLKHTLSFGIALYHDHLSRREKDFVVELYQNQQVLVLIATYTFLWELKARLLGSSLENNDQGTGDQQAQRGCDIGLVVVKGTKYYGADMEKDYAATATTSGYRDYELSEIMTMISFARATPAATACVLVDERKTNFIKRFLNEPLAIESSLGDHLPAYLHAEISSAEYSSRRDLRTTKDLLDLLSYSLFFQRIVENPSFYRSIVFDQLEAFTAHAENKNLTSGPVGKNPTSAQSYKQEAVKQQRKIAFSEEGEYLKIRILDALRQLESFHCLQVDWSKRTFGSTFAGRVATLYHVNCATIGRLETRVVGYQPGTGSTSEQNQMPKQPSGRPEFLEIIKLLVDECVELDKFALRSNEITNKRFWKSCESVRLHPFEYVADGKLKTLFNGKAQQSKNDNKGNWWRKLEKHGKEVKSLVLVQLHLLGLRAPSRALDQELRKFVRILPNLLKALIELAGHHGQLGLVMKAMRLYQAFARGKWPGDTPSSAMYRIPHWREEFMPLLNRELEIASFQDLQQATEVTSKWEKIEQLLQDHNSVSLTSSQLMQVKQAVTTAFPLCRIKAARQASLVRVEVQRSKTLLSGVFVVAVICSKSEVGGADQSVVAARHVEVPTQAPSWTSLEFRKPAPEIHLEVMLYADDSGELLQRLLVES